jgi:Protein of unknown function (DUF3179)
MQNVLTAPATAVARTSNRWKFWLLLFVLLAAAFALVAIPVFLIMPFKPQTQRALAVSYALKTWSPLLTVGTAVAVLALVVWLWRQSRRWWAKAMLVIVLMLSIVPAWFARQNHFEWMFNPLRNSSYTKAPEAKFVNDSDMVLAVKINNEAVAYPVRLMAYHHVVQDTVGGTPICATY